MATLKKTDSAEENSSLIYDKKFKKITLDSSETWNWFIHDNVTYELRKIESKNGGNSYIFILKDTNGIEPERILKICKYWKRKGTPNLQTNLKDLSEPIKRWYRFQLEIKALYKTKEKNLSHIINILGDGHVLINTYYYSYYIMEKAQSNLTEKIFDKEYDIDGKLDLSIQIIRGLTDLHNLNIYHRDIKPDNILFVDDEWKIADLGLCDYREGFSGIDEKGDKIGPFGFLSPEAANKAFTEEKLSDEFDCKINEKSDIFQLGKVLWFIFQGNVPMGQLKEEDLKNNNLEIYTVIEKMLQYDKSRRANFEYVNTEFDKISRN